MMHCAAVLLCPALCDFVRLFDMLSGFVISCLALWSVFWICGLLSGFVVCCLALGWVVRPCRAVRMWDHLSGSVMGCQIRDALSGSDGLSDCVGLSGSVVVCPGLWFCVRHCVCLAL